MPCQSPSEKVTLGKEWQEGERLTEVMVERSSGKWAQGDVLWGKVHWVFKRWQDQKAWEEVS